MAPQSSTARPPRYKTNPLPLRQMIPMAFVVLNETLSGAMLLPFVGLLVAHLQGKPPDEAGYLSGVLVGVFMLGQVASARTWGWISDQYGRRFPLISGLFTSGIMMLCFGLSTSVWQCALARFFQGLFNGNILVAKTMMADITDKSNEAKGFAFISLCNGMGFLIGPALGGLLYDPAHSSLLTWMHFSEDGMFGRHPALLPSLLIFFYTTVGMTVCTLFVQESNPKAKPLPSIVRYVYPCLWVESKQFVHPPLIEIMDDSFAAAAEDANNNVNASFVEAFASPTIMEDMRRFDSLTINDELPLDEGIVVDRHERPSAEVFIHGCPTEACAGCTAVLVDGEATKNESTPNDAGAPNDGDVVVESSNAEQHTDEPEVKRFGYKEAFQRPYTRFMLVQYMILSGADMTIRECFPLWAISSIDVGGLDFQSESLGILLLANSLPCFAANYFFSKAYKKYDNKMGLFRLGVLFGGVIVAFVSLTSYLPHGMFVYLLVAAMTSSSKFFMCWCYSLNTMLTARSAPKGHVGSIMGINQSCGALTRGIVPFVAAPIYAWSISGDHIFPFNHVLVFFLSAIAYAFCWWRSFSIRTNLDGKLEMVA